MDFVFYNSAFNGFIADWYVQDIYWIPDPHYLGKLAKNCACLHSGCHRNVSSVRSLEGAFANSGEGTDTDFAQDISDWDTSCTSVCKDLKTTLGSSFLTLSTLIINSCSFDIYAVYVSLFLLLTMPMILAFALTWIIFGCRLENNTAFASEIDSWDVRFAWDYRR